MRGGRFVKDSQRAPSGGLIFPEEVLESQKRVVMPGRGSVKEKIVKFVGGADVALIVCMLLGYLAFHLQVFLALDAYVPDEYNNFGMMNLIRDLFAQDKMGYLELPSQYGYGTLYWIVGTFIDDFRTIRLLNLFFLVSVVASIYCIAYSCASPSSGPGRHRTALYAVALWITFPISWFTGKIIGPELMSLFFGSLGLLLFARGRDRLAGLLIGLSIAIKLNAVVILLFLALNLYFTTSPASAALPRARKLALPVLIGFVLGNPYVVVDFPKFIWLLQTSTTESASFWEGLSVALFSKSWTWDCIYSGGFFDNTLSAATALLLVALAVYCRLPKKTFLPLVGAFFLFALLLSQSRSLGWYWLPFSLLVPFTVMTALPGTPGGKRLAVGIIAVNALFTAPTIGDIVRMKWMHIYDTGHVYETTVKINKLLEQNNLQTVDLVICIDIMTEGAPEMIASIKSGVVAWPSVILLGKRISFANNMGQLIADAKNNRFNLSYIGERDNVDILLKKGSSL